MPIYEYVCEKCNSHLEIIQKITEEPLTTCPDCKGQLKKMISNTSFVLKGTGWYVTDYASKKDSSAKTSPSQKRKDSSTTPSEAASPKKEPAASSK
ncbi:MAG: zinc ribbon domain-containing protein [Nitrospiraceae bacterium]|jgi:putative FmdB family regulatory protein|nr:MAG: zinc ribbon domain-containing protein [Nitrospiraceae bacterium]